MNSHNQQDKLIKAIIDLLSTNPDEAQSAGLIAYMMSKNMAGKVELTKLVKRAIVEARLQGHLILENARGYYLASDYDQFDAWRKEYVIARMTALLDMLHAMGRSAKQEFGRDDAPDLPVLN